VRIVAIVAALLAVVAAQASPAARPIAGLKASESPLFGLVWIDRTAELTQLDPSTLEPVGAAFNVGDFSAWGFSPDRGTLALGGVHEASVRFVDLMRLATIRSVKLAPTGSVERIGWLTGGSVVVLYASPVGERVAWIDPSSGRVTKRARLGVYPYPTVSGGGRLLTLLPPRKGGIGTARLAIIGAGGGLRIVRLPRIRNGHTQPAKGSIFRRVVPGLAFDPTGGHAYVVGTNDVVADVDLHSRTVATHALRPPRSLLARLGGWLVPNAEAKAVSGPQLQARWLGDGQVAVAGSSFVATLRKNEESQSATPLGLRIVDVRTWTERTIDENADGFSVATGALLAYGIRSELSSTKHSVSGMGVVAYGSDGRAQFRLLPGRPVEDVQVNGSRAYAWVAGGPGLPDPIVLDLAAGTVERGLTLAHPTSLLLDDGSFYG
jgi:hypothetical protein